MSAGQRKPKSLYLLSSSSFAYYVVESVREPCVEKGFVPIFLGVLNKEENVECVLQSCRALGNMCFDNGKLRVSRSPLVRGFTNQSVQTQKLARYLKFYTV